MADESTAVVIDTSSIAEIRRSVQNKQKRHVFECLTKLVQDGVLFFPKEVVKELARKADPESPDAQYEWARTVERAATATPVPYETVREVLAHVPRVLDPEKEGADEADPYVIAVGLELQRTGRRVVVVTEENKETPTKMSLRTAAGLLGLPAVPLVAFLESRGIV